MTDKSAFPMGVIGGMIAAMKNGIRLKSVKRSQIVSSVLSRVVTGGMPLAMASLYRSIRRPFPRLFRRLRHHRRRLKRSVRITPLRPSVLIKGVTGIKAVVTNYQRTK